MQLFKGGRMTLDRTINTLANSTRPRSETLGKLADLLERNNISVDEIGRIQRVSLYQSLTKNDEGEAEVHDLTAIQFVPAWQDGPAWPVVQPGPTVRVPPSKVQRAKTGDWSTAVILPDIQCGYFRRADEGLEPIHDEAALEVALAICADACPDQIVLVGDNADFCEFGRYRTTPAYARTTQATIDRLTVLGAQLRKAAPEARIVWLAGNHEERLPNFILDNAQAAFGLRRGNAPDSWPCLSVPFLCRFDDFGIEYIPGYPAGMHWITDRLRVIHGDKVASGGSTAHKYLANEKVSVIYGHIHRREYAARTREDHDGPNTVMAASPGCLCRVDGVVPSTKGGTDLDGRPLRRHEDWSQGLALVRYHTDGRFAYEPIAIHDGWAWWNGREYRSQEAGNAQVETA